MIDEKIYQAIQQLPPIFQEELLNFIQYLLMKAERMERQEWTDLSLSSAIQGMEGEESLYTLADIRIAFQ